jgi:hypothetical protein
LDVIDTQRSGEFSVGTFGGNSNGIDTLHWRSYGDHPLPSPEEALGEPLSAFPSWFLRIECDRCGKVQMVNEVHTPQRAMPLRAILKRKCHDGCGGRGRADQHALRSCDRAGPRAAL